MNMTVEEVAKLIALLMPSIASIVEILKGLFHLSGWGTRIASLVVGLGGALALVPVSIPHWSLAVLLGLLAGGLSSGLWKAIKSATH